MTIQDKVVGISADSYARIADFVISQPDDIVLNEFCSVRLPSSSNGMRGDPGCRAHRASTVPP